MKASLGLNLGTETSACLITKDRIYAAEEERWTGVKHNKIGPDESFFFPKHALEWILRESGISIKEIDTIHAVTLDPEFQVGSSNFLNWRFLQKFKAECNRVPVMLPHHQAHILSAYYLSPFQACAGLCIDGAGSVLGLDIGYRETVSGYVLSGNRAHRIYMNLPDISVRPNSSDLIKCKHSLGHFYYNFAIRLIPPGDEPEGSMMALASLGDPDQFAPLISDKLVLGERGGFRILNDLGRRLPIKYDIQLGGHTLTTEGAAKMPLHLRANIAASVQKLFEKAVVHVATHIHNATSTKNLVFAGGCALNSKLNGSLQSLTPFESVFVPPAPNDSGIALGAALFGYCNELGLPRPNAVLDACWGPRLQPTPDEVIGSLSGYRLLATSESSCIHTAVAELLMENKLVAVASGGLEFGPRALGSRSILANPTVVGNSERINRLKQRASYRPFAGAVLAHEFDAWFRGDGDGFMNKTGWVRNPQALPAITHVDGSARIQLVSEPSLLSQIIRKFSLLSGVPVLLNTSLNLKGKPIANSTRDVIECVRQLKIDALLINDALYIQEQ